MDSIRKVHDDLGSAKQAAHALADRDGCRWGVWRPDFHRCWYLSDQYDNPLLLSKVIYWANPNTTPAVLTPKQVAILKENGAW